MWGIYTSWLDLLGNLFLRLASTRVKVSEAEKVGRKLPAPVPLCVSSESTDFRDWEEADEL